MQSLPSFAQAFSSASLGDPVSNALPPIQRQKRTRATPDAVIKQEDSDDELDRDHSATPKKRRVTPPPQHTRRSPPALARIARVSPGAMPRCAPSPPIPDPAAAHALPPPPISFARRRAAQSGGRKKKPADILISPRGAGPSDPLAPVIQSAPPLADPGRFPMAIPRLPLALSSTQSTRRVAGNVPPTPTRFSLQGTAAPPTRTGPSPPHLSVPIASARVPPTPHAPSGDKSAFLAPFEVFYDALQDSKQLKGWLSDQLQKSNALTASLKQQQERMDEIVEDLVEKRTRAMRDEMAMLRQRMESLEEALLAVRAESSTNRYPNGADAEHPPSMSPPRRLSISRSESAHCRRPSGSAKPTPPVRTASRMYYPETKS